MWCLFVLIGCLVWNPVTRVDSLPDVIYLGNFISLFLYQSSKFICNLLKELYSIQLIPHWKWLFAIRWKWHKPIQKFYLVHDSSDFLSVLEVQSISLQTILSSFQRKVQD